MLRRLVAAAVVVASTLTGAHATARAVPPTAPFPAAITPAGPTLPANGRALVFGGALLSLDDIGASATLDGAALPLSLERAGCCSALVRFSEALPVGAEVELFVTAPGGDASAAWTVGEDDDAAPTLDTVEVVQVVSATRLVPPMTPAEGPAVVLTLDLSGVADDVEVAALASYDVDGELVTLEPPSGQVWERVLTGAPATGEEACVGVEVIDAAGQASRRARVCAALPDGRDDQGPSAFGCAATTTATAPPAAGWVAALLAAALLGRRTRAARRGRRRRAALTSTRVTLALALGASSCALPSESTRLCDDGFDDHTFEAAAFDDAFFDAHAREQYGWRALKLLVVHLEEPSRRRVGFYDEGFYALHDEWFYFRLVNGAEACGADEIAPATGLPAFDTVDEVVAWARAQERLPPFLSWSGARLTAPDFYRLSRDTTPRVYAPAYLTRDVDGEPDAYAVRVAGPDAISAEELRALFEALDPWMPPGTPLYWRPSPQRESHQALADALEAANDPLAARVRRR